MLTFLVSVVWSTVRGTYFLDDSDGYNIFSDSKLHSYQGPIFQTGLNVNFEDDGHHIVIPHLPIQEVRYHTENFHSFPKFPTHNLETGFKPMIPKSHLKQTIPRHLGFVHQNEHNKHLHHNQQITQQQVEVKSGFDIPHLKNIGLHQSFLLDTRYPISNLLRQSHITGSDFLKHLGQSISPKEADQNLKHAHTVQTQDVTQQKIVNVGFQEVVEQKSEDKDNEQSYDKTEQKSITDVNSDDKQEKTYETPETKSGVSPENTANYDLQNNERVYPVIYNQSPLIQGQYIRLVEDHGDSYAEIPGGYGSTGEVYRELRPSDGIVYQPHLNSHHHDGPIYISRNFHGNLDGHARILIDVDNHGESIGIVNGDLDGPSSYSLLGANISHETPDYQQKIDDSGINYEQKPVVVDLKSNDDPEYKDISNMDTQKYPESGKTDSSYSIEQKAVEVGIKGGSENSYNLEEKNDEQYKEEKKDSDSGYQTTSIKTTDDNIEQKSVDTSFKNTDEQTEYDEGSSQYSSKDSGSDTQQKSVDVDFKSSDKSDYKPLDDSVSEYAGIGSIDIPKYSDSNSKKSEQKLEQKSVETETYREAKASFKSSSSLGSSKSDSGYSSSGINDYKKDIGSKLSSYRPPIYVERGKLGNKKHQTYPGAATSSSYFNTGSLSHNNNYESQRNNPFVRSNHGSSSRSNYNDNNNHGNIGNSQRHTNSYFSRTPTSHGSSVNYHSPTFTSNNIHSQNSPFISNHNRPTGQTRFSQQPTSYVTSGISRYPGNQGISSGFNVPRYQGHSSGGSGSHENQGNEKFVKVSYQYPHQSLKKDEPIYASSTKPKEAQRSYSDFPSHRQSGSYKPQGPATSVNYLRRGPAPSLPSYPTSGDKDSDSYGGSDYSNGIGAIEYPGIGEKSSKSSSDTKPTSYSASTNKKSPTTQQKSYDDEETIPTYSESKEELNQNEYKGIGEIGGTLSTKSEVVGGRHPVRRPLKNLKTKSSGVKGRNNVKTEQKYLPITAALSGESGKKGPSVKYESVKTKTPDKVEQQEEEGYEALLGEGAPPGSATGSSGYGFDKPPTSGIGSISHRPAYDDTEVSYI